MKSRTAILIGLALLLAYPFALHAQIPRTISYQGVLSDATGNVKPDGPYSFTFRLYDVSSGGTALWTEENKALEVEKGLFSTVLGAPTPFPASLRFDRPYWLGIQVESEELSPRIALTSSPYSFHALRADTAISINPSTDLLSNSIQTCTYSITNSADFRVENSSSGGTALYVEHNGLGKAGEFLVYNESNNNTAFEVETYGTGGAGHFEITNSSSGATALTVETDAAGRALNVKSSGMSECAMFEINNTSSTGDAIWASTNGVGHGIYARTTGSGYAGYFDGNVYATGSYLGSDIRWKQNITPLAGALNNILALRGVQFEWKLEEYPDNGFREGKQIGLIAQEVEAVLPELVRTDNEGYKALDYPKITAVLVEAVKEQQKQIEELKAAVAALQGQSDVALQELVQE